MGILCDPNFESGKMDNEKVNDIIATASFIDDAMGKFIENCVLQEIYDLSAELSKQPELRVRRVTKLPHNKIVHWMVNDMSYYEKLKLCKKIAPNLFKEHKKGLQEIAEIRNRVAHEWSRGEVIEQEDKTILTDWLNGHGINEEVPDIDDEYKKFQELYDQHRDFILTLEQKFSSEHLGLHEKQS